MRDPAYRFEGQSPIPCPEVEFPVFEKRVLEKDSLGLIVNDGVVARVRITTERSLQPVYDYNIETLSVASWLDKVTADYAVSDKFRLEGTRFFLSREGDPSMTSYVVRVDLNHLCDICPLWGFFEWRCYHDSKFKCVYYSLQDVMNCLGYSSRKSSQSVLNDLCHRMPMEMKVRLLKLRWHVEKGHPCYFGDIFVVRTLLSMVTLFHRFKKDEVTVKGCFTPEFLHKMCERIILGRLSVP